MTDWPSGCPHISTQHNRRDQKGLVMIKHPVTKNSAKEEPQNYIKKNIFHTFKNLVLVCAFKIFGVIVLFQCFTVTLTKV